MARAAAIFNRGELGLTRTDRPRGAFLTVGPSGTGKTELVFLTVRYPGDPDPVRAERRRDLLVAHELRPPQEQHVAVGREQAAVVRGRVVVPGVLQETGVKIGGFCHSQNISIIWL